jgi:single-stranded DNA-binding protein
MTEMLRGYILGTIAGKKELRITDSGAHVLRFKIMSAPPNRVESYHIAYNVAVWGDLAKSVAQWLADGHRQLQ